MSNPLDNPPKQAKNLPPNPFESNLSEKDRFKLAILQARMSALLPLIFLLSAMSIITISFIFPERAKQLAYREVVTGLITMAASLAKPNS